MVGNGRRTYYEYDVAQRLTRMTHEVTATGESFKILEYDWYDNGLLEEIYEPDPDTGLLGFGRSWLIRGRRAF